jgi:hypothetical protein
MHAPNAASSNTPLTREAMEPFWLPMTPNRQFKSKSRFFVGAEGMHYITQDGRRILDGMAGLWCVNAGHGQKRIVEAIQTQAAKLDFVSSLPMSHPASFELAGRIVEIAPAGLDHVFFTKFRPGVRRYRTQDRARLPPRARSPLISMLVPDLLPRAATGGTLAHWGGSCSLPVRRSNRPTAPASSDRTAGRGVRRQDRQQQMPRPPERRRCPQSRHQAPGASC